MPFVLRFHQHLVLSIKKLFSGRSNRCVVVSKMLKNLFLCLFVICVSSPVKCFFKSFAYFFVVFLNRVAS